MILLFEAHIHVITGTANTSFAATLWQTMRVCLVPMSAGFNASVFASNVRGGNKAHYKWLFILAQTHPGRYLIHPEERVTTLQFTADSLNLPPGSEKKTAAPVRTCSQSCTTVDLCASMDDTPTSWKQAANVFSKLDYFHSFIHSSSVYSSFWSWSRCQRANIRVQPGRVTKSSGPHEGQTTIHVHPRTYGQFKMTDSPQIQVRKQTRNLCATRWQR